MDGLIFVFLYFQFDFRIYVLVTSINPLRIYLYKNGLVRFATEKFSTNPEVNTKNKKFPQNIKSLFLFSQKLSNMYIHLTNFSVNKKGEVPTDYPKGQTWCKYFRVTFDADLIQCVILFEESILLINCWFSISGCQVNKWTIYELWDYLRDVDGVDPEPFWDGVKDVVIKTLLCGHENIDKMVKQQASSFYNNFNLLGLDIFIDTDMKPYLLEVNTIPSLFINQVSKEVDTNLKAPLVAEVFNISGHHISSGNNYSYIPLSACWALSLNIWFDM